MYQKGDKVYLEYNHFYLKGIFLTEIIKDQVGVFSTEYGNLFRTYKRTLPINKLTEAMYG